jgi:hypothetical protein
LGVRLRLSDPELADNLRNFLERRECAVIEIDAETLEVELPHEIHAEQARLELDLYLRVWQSLHDWSAVEYVEKPSLARLVVQLTTSEACGDVPFRLV